MPQSIPKKMIGNLHKLLPSQQLLWRRWCNHAISNNILWRPAISNNDEKRNKIGIYWLTNANILTVQYQTSGAGMAITWIPTTIGDYTQGIQWNTNAKFMAVLIWLGSLMIHLKSIQIGRNNWLKNFHKRILPPLDTILEFKLTLYLWSSIPLLIATVKILLQPPINRKYKISRCNLSMGLVW